MNCRRWLSALCGLVLIAVARAHGDNNPSSSDPIAASAGRQLSVLQDVYKSESDTNQRNQAIGMLMYAYEYIKSNPMQAVDLYTRQCSVGVNAKDLAMMAATLAFGGRNPVTKTQVLDPANVPYVLAVMATAGLYDDSGKSLYHTGLPSVRAQKAITDIVKALHANPYAPPTINPSE